MKTKIFLLSTLMVLTGARFAIGQTAIKTLQSAASQPMSGLPDSLKNTWTIGGLVTLNFSQGTSSNWSAGAQDFSMSLSSVDNFFAVYKKGKNRWDNTLSLN
jgi:hypothetical protein